MQELELDFWQAPRVGAFDVRVPTKSMQAFLKLNIEHTQAIADVQALIDAEKVPAQIPLGARQLGDEFFTKYQEWPELLEWMQKMKSEHSDIAELRTWGQTDQGNDMIGFVIRGKKAPKDAKKIIFHG